MCCCCSSAEAAFSGVCSLVAWALAEALGLAEAEVEALPEALGGGDLAPAAAPAPAPALPAPAAGLGLAAEAWDAVVAALLGR